MGGCGEIGGKKIQVLPLRMQHITSSVKYDMKQSVCSVAFANQIALVYHNLGQPCAVRSKVTAADLRPQSEKMTSLPKKLKVARKASSKGDENFCKPFNPHAQSSRF